MTAVARSWLYVPGHRSERVRKALISSADAIIVDLEDAVPTDRKNDARQAARALAADPATPTNRLWIRVNDPTGQSGEADLDAVTGLPLAGLRLPRCEDPDVVRHVANRTRLPVQLLIETAAGLAKAVELAAAHPLVVGIGLGEADLGADLRVGGDEGLDWARGYVVMAARAAGLPSPVQSVYTDVADLDGLRTSTLRGRELGFVGRSVVHPRQIAVVNEVFTPTAAEIKSALAVVETAERARLNGEAAVLDSDGRFIDPAVVARARVVLDLSQANESQEKTHDQ